MSVDFKALALSGSMCVTRRYGRQRAKEDPQASPTWTHRVADRLPAGSWSAWKGRGNPGECEVVDAKGRNNRKRSARGPRTPRAEGKCRARPRVVQEAGQCG